MSQRKAVWVEDDVISHCTKCQGVFTFRVPKHHCRRCGLIYCSNCSKNKMIIPAEELVSRPSNWLKQNLPPDMLSDEDSFRCPHRVCDECAVILKDRQEELRLQVSR
jgi:hypothetical protein